MQLLDLPAPKVIEEIDFEKIKQRKLDRVLSLMKQKDIEYVPSESDDLMTAIEADAYEEMLLRARINNTVKAQLLAYATGSDLDHIGATRYGVVRLEGAKPYADFTFTISQANGSDIVLERGLMLGSDTGERAYLANDAVIEAGATTVNAKVEFDAFVQSSDIKCETILTPLPWVVEATQNETFHSGADIEDDERFRERIWLSRERKSTAGSEYMYKYYAKSADVRVDDVQVVHESAGIVGVYLLGPRPDGVADGLMIDRVESALDAKDIRPLTDSVQVQSANIIDVTISATITLYDLTYQEQVKAQIEKRIDENTFVFGKDLSLAKIYGILESEQVKDVNLSSPAASVACDQSSVVSVQLDLVFEGGS